MAEMNLSTAELLQQMIDIKQDMRTALNNKDVSVVGGMISYPSAIDSISQGIDVGGKIKLYDKPRFGGDFTTFPDIFDTSGVTNLYGMFRDCSSLTSVPLLDTSSVTDIGSMFRDCSSLTTIPLLDTSNVTSMSNMFEKCSSLTTIPLLNTSSVVNMRYMFYGCTSLTTIPLLDTSNVTSMSNMLRECTSLTTIPLLNTSSVTDMGHMFYKCSSLTTIPLLNTSSVTDMESMFRDCSSLTSVPLLDTSNVTNTDYMFYGCTSLTDVDGFKDFGKQPELSVTIGWGLQDSKLLTRQSCINIFNNLYDRRNTAVYYNKSELWFHQDVINKLTADDLAIAANKGWTVETYHEL